MKRIGLLNLQYIDNYGANLISYAMEKVVNELLPESMVQTINYAPDENIVYKESESIKNYYLQFGLYKTIKFKYFQFLRKTKALFRNNILVKRIINIYKGRDINYQYIECEPQFLRERKYNFQKYRENYLNLSNSLTSDEVFSQSYDAIIVGSDVIWKPQRLLSNYVNKVFFLKNNKPFKRIAYAASLGVSDQNELKRLIPYYQTAIKEFDAVSIREVTTTQYIQSIFPDKVVYNCVDPVFLPNPDDYLPLIKNSDEQPYIYAYLLGKNNEAFEYVQHLAKQKNLPIKYHSKFKFDGINCESDGPCEFLQRIYNAEYVITDSFHGTAFSIIFRKKFLTFTRGILSVRLEDFLHHINLEERLVSTVTEKTNIDEDIIYEKSFNILNDWISDSKQFISNSLKEEHNENCCNNAN